MAARFIPGGASSLAGVNDRAARCALPHPSRRPQARCRPAPSFSLAFASHCRENFKSAVDSSRPAPYIAGRRPDGGIGRRASFRCWYSKGCGGSSPLLGTSSIRRTPPGPLTSRDFFRLFAPPARAGENRLPWSARAPSIPRSPEGAGRSPRRDCPEFSAPRRPTAARRTSSGKENSGSDGGPPRT